MTLLLCPHGNSNPGLSIERASSWATRRWGHIPKRARLSRTPRSFLKEACGIVSSHKLIVNEKGVQFTRSVHADRVHAFDVAGGGWTRDEDRGFRVAYEMDDIFQ